MSRPQLKTPCPAPANGHRPQHRLSDISSAYDTSDNTTANIDFTRALVPSLKNGKPRRSSLVHSKINQRAPVTIFEEVQEDEELLLNQNKQIPKGKTLLCKPARRMAIGAGAAATAVDRQTSRAEAAMAGGLREVHQARARPSIMKTDISSVITAREHLNGEVNLKTSLPKETAGLKKEPRRRTIFIPEDTTLLTIHPGADTTTRLDDTFQLPSFAVESSQQPAAGQRDTTGPSAIHKPVRRPRKSLMAAPRRAPLQIQNIDHNQKFEGWDVCGENTGKENLPPLGLEKFKASVNSSPEAQALNNAPPRSRLFEPTAASQSRPSILPRDAVPLSNRFSTASSRQNQASRSPTANPRLIGSTRRSTDLNMKLHNPFRPHLERKLFGSIAPAHPVHKFSGLKDKDEIQLAAQFNRLELFKAKLEHFPPLSEDLPQTALYEDNWLSEQEVALTEVINEIFRVSSPAVDHVKVHEDLRESLIGLYHQEEVTLMYRHIEASTRMGALARPKMLSTLPNLSNDLGMRKRIISLWFDTYDEEILRAALEVIVGRRVLDNSSATQPTLDEKASRRALIDFFETFFIFVADATYPPGNLVDTGVSGEICWRKAMQRSLMLVWLLDEAKSSGLIKGTLFKHTASKKSSAAVLRTLGSLLMPYIGDITRVLKQYRYEISHVQDPLDEVNYQINNIAVDLRDGAILAHLVEILLYSRQAKSEILDNNNATITIALPDNTILASALHTPAYLFNSRMLSQHLKMPCLSRTLRVYNAQISLSALEGSSICGMNVVGDVTADDIVNGHREKTLSLLWSLVSSYGLDYLVDWNELVLDIERMQSMTTSTDNLLSSEKYGDKEVLLQTWAAVHTSNAGMGDVKNLNTSFADGKPYNAIVQSFAIYNPFNNPASLFSNTKRTALGAQLESFGCSVAFTKQITSTLGIIPSREATVSNLTFLASRLLPLAKKHRAAMVIQRAFRKHRAPTIASQRIALMRLAHDCATVVLTSQRMATAATTIQRAWRAYFDRGLEAIDKSILDLQTIARAWAVRKAVSGGNATRVMGGW